MYNKFMMKFKLSPSSFTFLISIILLFFLLIFYFFLKQSKDSLLKCFVENSKDCIVSELDTNKSILGRGTITDNVFVLNTGTMPDDISLYSKDGAVTISQGIIIKSGKVVIFYSNSAPVKKVISIYNKFYIYIIIFALVFVWIVFVLYMHFIKSVKLLEESINSRVTPSDSKPNLKGFSGVFQNISSLYDELEATELEVNRKSKLEGLGVLLSKILHDLNNVISTLKIYHYIMNNTSEEEKKEECLNKINDSLENMTEMVADTFSFIRGEDNKLVSNIRVIDLSNGLISEYSEKAEMEKICLNIKVEKGLENQMMSVNAIQIMTALRNLIQNAFEELAECDIVERKINITFARFINDLHIEIKDNGRGLPVLVVEKLFTPFITEGKAKGTGLGIPIAKEYIEENGGIIDVETSKKGTIFKINIPLIIENKNNLNNL